MIVYGERLTHGTRGGHAARALLNVAGRVVSADHEGSGLLELPTGTNGRGLREVGMLPNAAPGVAPVSPVGLDSDGIGATAATGDLERAVPHARRPAARPARPAHVARGARADRHDHRARRLPQRGAVGVRRHRLPRRVLRREGGHGHAPRRARAAPAPGDRATRRGARGVEHRRRPRRPARARPGGAERADGVGEALRGGPVLRRPDARRARRARRALDRAPRRGGLAGRPTPARSASRSRRTRRRRTGRCAWARSARSGRRPRSSCRPR